MLSSSFARSYASDFSPGDADGRRGGATGALSPPTTHGVHLAPSRLRAPNLSCHLQLIHSRRHEHSHAATAWYWWWQPIRAVAVRPSSPCQTASSCRSVRAQRSFESPTRCRKVVGPLRRGACWPRLAEVNADGADGRVKWNGSKQFRRRAAWPLVRSPVAASDGRGSSSIGARSSDSQSHLAVVSVGTQVASRCAAVTTGVLASTCPPLWLQAGRALEPEIGTRDPLAQSLLP